MSKVDVDDASELAAGWWVAISAGVVSMVFGFLVLSFSYTTVWAIAVWAGSGLVLTGLAELGLGILLHGAARWITISVGLIGVGAGTMAFAWPAATFLVLARLVGWVLLLRGTLDVISSLHARQVGDDTWWLALVLGVVEIAVAFWAARYPGRSIALLVLWVGITAVARGLAMLFLGFGLRSLRRTAS